MRGGRSKPAQAICFRAIAMVSFVTNFFFMCQVSFLDLLPSPRALFRVSESDVSSRFPVGEEFNSFWECMTKTVRKNECNRLTQLSWNDDTEGGKGPDRHSDCLLALAQSNPQSFVPAEGGSRCPWFDADFGFRGIQWMPTGSILSDKRLAMKWRGKWVYFLGDSLVREYFYGFVTTLMSDVNGAWQTPFPHGASVRAEPKVDFEGTCVMESHSLCQRDWVINGVRVSFTFVGDQRKEDFHTTTFLKTFAFSDPPDACVVGQFAWYDLAQLPLDMQRSLYSDTMNITRKHIPKVFWVPPIAMPVPSLDAVQEMQRMEALTHNLTFIDIIPLSHLIAPYARNKYHKQLGASFELARILFYGLCLELQLCTSI